MHALESAHSGPVTTRRAKDSGARGAGHIRLHQVNRNAGTTYWEIQAEQPHKIAMFWQRFAQHKSVRQAVGHFRQSYRAIAPPKDASKGVRGNSQSGIPIRSKVSPLTTVIGVGWSRVRTKWARIHMGGPHTRGVPKAMSRTWIVPVEASHKRISSAGSRGEYECGETDRLGDIAIYGRVSQISQPIHGIMNIIEFNKREGHHGPSKSIANTTIRTPVRQRLVR